MELSYQGPLIYWYKIMAIFELYIKAIFCLHEGIGKRISPEAANAILGAVLHR